MKILTGQFRGRNIYMPAEIRPTQNVTRKAVFDLIGHDLTGLSFLDLYAGSGAVGLEALSSGASKVTFVEKMPVAVEAIEENLRMIFEKSPTLLKQSTYEVVPGDAMAAITQFSREKKTFDVIFLDPPYDLGLVKKTLKTLMAYDIVQPVSFLIVQHSPSESLPDLQEKFTLLKHRQYGKTFLAIYQPNPGQGSGEGG